NHNTEAEAEARKAVALDPDNVRAHFVLGRVLFGTGRVDDAIVEYRRAIALQPNEIAFYGPLAEALAKDERDLDGAITAFQRLLELNPNDVAARNQLSAATA